MACGLLGPERLGIGFGALVDAGIVPVGLRLELVGGRVAAVFLKQGVDWPVVLAAPAAGSVVAISTCTSAGGWYHWRVPILPYLEHVPAVGRGVALADDAYVVGKVSVAGPARARARARCCAATRTASTIGRAVSHRARLDDPRRAAYADADRSRRVARRRRRRARATLGDGVRVEDGGLVLSTSKVGAGSIVAADALVPEGVEFPDNSYISGTPGRRRARHDARGARGDAADGRRGAGPGALALTPLRPAAGC